MIEQKDYIMRIIHEWIRTLIKLIFNKDIDRDEEESVPLEVMEQYRKLIAMIDDGEINEAENILLDWTREAGHILRWRFYFTRNWAENQRHFSQNMITPRRK